MEIIENCANFDLRSLDSNINITYKRNQNVGLKKYRHTKLSLTSKAKYKDQKPSALVQ